MGDMPSLHRWVEHYYRIRKGRVENVRAHWWPRIPSGLMRSEHKIKG
jgi:hypothetical protein